jgi:hypothetical protein
VRAERGIAECETWWYVGLLIQRATMLLNVTVTYRRRHVNEELKDLAGFSHNTPVSCLLSPTDTGQIKPVITAVTLNKTIKLLRIMPCMFKNVN